jgi:hypothetical protein
MARDKNPKAEFPASPTLCDVDGDGKLDVVVVGLDNLLHVLGGKGREKPGFPVDGGVPWASAPACADLDGDRRPEILWTARDGALRAVDGTGKPVAGFPVPDVRAAEGMVAVGDIRPEPGVEIALGSTDGKVHLLGRGPSGRWANLSGFPVQTQFTVSGGPAMGDLDGDGSVDIVFGSQDFTVVAVRADGRMLSGFPVKTDYRLYAQPALGDLDADGKLEIVIGGGDGKIHALRSDGTPVPGWPVAAGARVVAGAAIGDLDVDGVPEVVVASTDGRLHVLRANGTPVGGFPESPGGALSSSPLIVDLDGDGRLEVVAGGQGGRLRAYSFMNLGKVRRPVVHWPTVGHDEGRVSRLRPNPGTFKGLALVPASPRTEDDLSVSYTFLDLDGDPERDTQIRWLRNDQPVKELDNKPVVPRALTRKGERWQFSLQEGENFQTYGDGKGATVFRAEPRAIGNTAPTAAGLAFLVPDPGTEDPVEVTVATPSQDPDGDQVTYGYRWFRNREPVAGLPPTTTRIDPSRTRKGEVWSVVVVPFDGTQEGPSASVDVAVRNSVPTTPEVRLEPAQPGAADVVKAVIVKGSTDADRDPIRYALTWSVDGAAIPFSPDRDTLPSLATRKGQRVTLAVTARDDEAPGVPATLEYVVANTLPTPPRVAVLPPQPRTNDALVAAVETPSRDVDGDAVTYAFSWTRDGQPVPAVGEGWSVSPEVTAKNQELAMSVVPTDGTAAGAPVRAVARVVDSPPGPARVVVTPVRPLAGQPLAVKVVEQAQDADGDAVTYRVTWTASGKEATARARGMEVPAGVTKKGEVWQATVVAHDKELDGRPVGSVEVEVQDTPPTAAVVELVPGRGGTEEGLEVKVVRAGEDVDGEKVTYRYRWYVDGALQDVGEETARVGPERTARGQRWRVEVVSVAGGVEGGVAVGEAEVVNTAPRAPELVVWPVKPLGGESLVVGMERGPADADGDGVTVRYAWKVNGTESGLTGPVVPAGRTKKGELWEVVARTSDGREEGEVGRVEVGVGNRVPEPPVVVVTGGELVWGGSVEAREERGAVDGDGDRVTVTYRWLVDGKEEARLRGKRRVEWGEVKKNQRLVLEVEASDGTDVARRVAGEVVVRNTVPTRPEVRFKEGLPTAPQALEVEVVQGSRDVDGDKVGYRYRYWRNGKREGVEEGSGTVPGRLVRRGDRWRVEVVGHDGEGEGEAGWSEVVVVNGAPSAPVVRFDRGEVTVARGLRVEVVKGSEDADGDALSYRYRYWRNGVEVLGLGRNQGWVPRGALKKGERWKVEVVSFDGEKESGKGTAEAVVVNGVPSAPVVRFRSGAVTVGEELGVEVVEPSVDVDGDKVTYRHRYWRNGQRVGVGEGERLVPVREMRKGDHWRVEVVGHDGEKEGEAGSAEAVVVNAAPTVPEVRLLAREWKAGQPLRVEVVKGSQDADGDKVRYRYRFRKGGEVVKGDEWEGSVPGRLVAAGERWSVEVVGTDGERESGVGRSEGVVGVAEARRAVEAWQDPAGPGEVAEPGSPVPAEGSAGWGWWRTRCRVVAEGKAGEAARAGDGLGLEVEWGGGQEVKGHRVRWKRNGTEVAGGPGARVSPGTVKKGEVWQAELVGTEGELSGKVAACLELRIGDTPPGPPAVTLAPTAPRAGQPLEAKVVKPAPDVDGDAVTYRYRWAVHGMDGQADVSASTLPADAARKGQVWRVEVTSVADGVEGGSARAEVRVVNSPPSRPEVVVEPEAPYRGDGLEARVDQGAQDPDGDAVTLRFSWTVNGQPAGVDGPRVPSGRVKRGETWRVSVVASDGESTSEKGEVSVTVRNRPPTPPAIAMGPAAIRAGQPVEVKVERPAADGDGDKVTLGYAWLVNGKEEPRWRGRTRLEAADLKKNRRVRVEVTPHDGTEEGPQVHAEVRVLNTLPTAPAVAFQKATVRVGEPLRVEVSKPSTDADGDAVRYRYRFFRNGTRAPVDEGSPAVPPALVRKGDRWHVVVAPFDGQDEGPAAESNAEVLNTPPEAVKVVLNPSKPKTTDPLACTLAGAAHDADGDTLAFRYRWARNGKPLPIFNDGNLPAEAIHRGETWTCGVAAFDGEVWGPWTDSAPVTVQNTAPTAPQVGVSPVSPRVGEALACRVLREALDADGDPVRYAFHWERNGKPLPAADGLLDIPGKEVARGDRWACWAEAWDDQLGSGKGGPRAAVAVGNSAPFPPTVEVQPASPRAGTALRCEVTKLAQDVDGDKITYRVDWERDGVRQPFASTEMVVAGRWVQAGQQWRCVLTASDGKQDSLPARSPPVTVLPGLPAAPTSP